MRQCTVCQSPQLVDVQEVIVSRQMSFEQIAEHFGLARSSVHRHAVNHMGRRMQLRGNAAPNSPKPGSHPRSGLDDQGRCLSCGLIAVGLDSGKLEPRELLRRGERLLFLGEQEALNASGSGDGRHVVTALGAAQKSFDSLAKCIGMIGPDVVIDQRQQVSIYAKWELSALSALELFHQVLSDGGSVRDALNAVEKEQAPALPRPENESEAA